jgi:hypothetical protein
MRLDIFSEMQHPKEHWTGPDHEHRLIQETLEQRSSRTRWAMASGGKVEHHNAGEFSYSSAPEVMLTAIAMRTKRIHVGHSSVLAPGRLLPHEKVMKSIHLTGALLPEFKTPAAP